MDHTPPPDTDVLAPLLASELAPLFLRPTRLDVISAWYGHIPFAHWIVRAARPAVLVELGTHNGVSYSAFCDSVLEERLPTRCFAVDTWQGDEHAGFYSEQVFSSFKAFHAARYAGFSELLRCTFDDALPYIADASVDLLHIDGRHHYEDVAHDFASWLPKLSPRAVVLFHDTNVRERNFGVWRLFGELAKKHSTFEFLHGHGLGVLAWGDEVPETIKDLCALSGEATSLMRERFATLGERWVLNSLQRELEETRGWGAKAQTEVNKLFPAYQSCLATLRTARTQLAEARFKLASADIASEQAADVRNGFTDAGLAHRPPARDLKTPQVEVANLRSALADARAEIAALRASRTWRMALALQRILHPGAQRPPAAPLQAQAQEDAPVPEHDWASDAKQTKSAAGDSWAGKRILLISGESDTPGHIYRIVRAMDDARALGWTAEWSEIAPVNPDLIRGASIVLVWRVPYSQHVQGIIDCAHGMGAKVVFDIDDLMFRRDYANAQLIDGIRSQRFSEADTADFFEKIGRTMAQADIVTCPTEELASQVRFVGKPAFVMPNGFGNDSVGSARLAVRTWRGFPDNLVRIGYAGGSRTHQRDFAQAVRSLARLLTEHQNVRLVLFRDPRSGEGVVLADEYEILLPVAGQIEWRDMVPLSGLPAEIARFDINLAPLEPDNLFCAAKSELKYFEAALAAVPTIASPVGRIGRAIQPGITGMLAGSDAEWYACLRDLHDNPDLRAQIGRNAYHDALWRYGPQQRRTRLRSLFAQIAGHRDAAAAFAHDLHAPALSQHGLPQIPSARTMFHEDRLGQADVTVIIPVHNYADYVVEALESVSSQTLDLLDLVVVDDFSSDDSLAMVTDWCRAHAGRFNRLKVVAHVQNSGLAAARNSGFAAAETAFVLPLDADNRLRRDCCSALLKALAPSEAAFAYPVIRQFGDSTATIGDEPYSALRLLQGNYIDAMALVAKWAWAAAGGYANIRYGWEDFDFWARLVEQGQFGISVPQVLADYRVHRASMLHTTTEVHDHKRDLVADLAARHPWLDIGRLADALT